MISEKRVLDIFKEAKVLLEGHFLLTSGKHSDKYLQCARVFQYPHYTEELSKALAYKFEDADIDMVIGPAIGGIVLSYEMGRALNVKTVFSERENGKMVLRRGFDIAADSRILVVEDVVTTGGSVYEVIELIKELGSKVVGVGAIVDRSNGIVDFGVPFHSAIKVKVDSYEPDNCPMCKSEMPLLKPGSRTTK